MNDLGVSRSSRQSLQHPWNGEQAQVIKAHVWRDHGTKAQEAVCTARGAEETRDFIPQPEMSYC